MSRDKVGSGIFNVLYFIGKFLGFVPLNYDFEKKIFLTSVPATVMSSVICIFAVIISPVVYKWNSDIFLVAEVDLGDNMFLITRAQSVFDFVSSFVVLLRQLWRRKQVTRSANDFRKACKQLTTKMDCAGIITLQMIFLIAMKFSITIYEVLVNIPFLIQYSDFITPYRFVAFFLKLYITVIAPVFTDVTFVGLLLLARYFYLVDHQLESLKMETQPDDVQHCRLSRLRLLRLYLRLRRMVAEFSENVEIPIFVQILNSFTNMLSNLYALLHFYAAERDLDFKLLVYNVMIFCNICLLIHAAERVKRRSADLKDTLLDIDPSGEVCDESDWKSDELVFKIWPEVFEVNILGMFSLNNMFLLFLISYATNFVVIILQFQLTKMM